MRAGTAADAQDSASPADGTPSWWAASAVWRGDRRLFARIAIAAEEQLALRGLAHECAITFHVRGDTEGFASVAAFQQNVTTQALREFRDASIWVGGGALSIDVVFRRRRHNVRVLRRNRPASRGVSVTVTTTTTRWNSAAQEIRDVFVLILDRGTRMILQWHSTERGHSPDDSLTYGLAKAGQWRASAYNNIVYAAATGSAIGLADRLHANILYAFIVLNVLRVLMSFFTISGTAFVDVLWQTIEISELSSVVRTLRAVAGFVFLSVAGGVIAAALSKALGL